MTPKQNIVYAILAIVPVIYSLECSGRTEDGEVHPCIFPFKLSNGTQLENCTAAQSDTGHPWCPTQLNASGFEQRTARGECPLECARPALRHSKKLSISPPDGCHAGYLPSSDTKGRIDTQVKWILSSVSSHRRWSCPMTLFIPSIDQRLYFRVDSAYGQGYFLLKVRNVEFYNGQPRAANLVANLTEKSVRLGQEFASSPGARTVTVVAHFPSLLESASSNRFDGDVFGPQISFSLTPFPEHGTTPVPVKLCPSYNSSGWANEDCVERTTTRRPTTTTSPYGGDRDRDGGYGGEDNDDDDSYSYLVAVIFIILVVIVACLRRRATRGGCCDEAAGTTTYSTAAAYHYSAPGHQQQPVVGQWGTVVPGGSPAAPGAGSPYVPTGGDVGTQAYQPTAHSYHPTAQAQQPTARPPEPSAPPQPMTPIAGSPNYAATVSPDVPPPPSYDEAMKVSYSSHK